MNFRSKPQSGIPQTDLIPMLNVMLGMMAYFIIVTMTMSSQSSFSLLLPDEIKQDDVEDVVLDLLDKKGPMVVELAKDGRFVIEKAQLNEEKFLTQLKVFLAQNKTDPVFLKPDKQQGYENVLQTLAMMRKIGGDRISLVIDDIDS